MKKGPKTIRKLTDVLLLFPFFAHLADLNLLDWSSGNILAVALDNSVYLWNAGSGDILQLLQMEQPGDYISSVAWIKEGNYLAVGTSNAEVQVRHVLVLQLCWLLGPVGLPQRKWLANVTYQSLTLLLLAMGCATAETASKHDKSLCPSGRPVLE